MRIFSFDLLSVLDKELVDVSVDRLGVVVDDVSVSIENSDAEI